MATSPHLLTLGNHSLVYRVLFVCARLRRTLFKISFSMLLRLLCPLVSAVQVLRIPQHHAASWLTLVGCLCRGHQDWAVRRLRSVLRPERVPAAFPPRCLCPCLLPPVPPQNLSPLSFLQFPNCHLLS